METTTQLAATAANQTPSFLARKPSALAVMASRFSVDPTKLLSTLKSTVFKGASDDELMALVIVANEYGLNPLTKEMYAFPAKGGGIVPVVSVDGWTNLVNSHIQMDGLDFEFGHDEKGGLISCTCIIYRKDRSRPIRVTEYLAECRRNTDPWKMEHRMLRHKALIQCARVAFGFSGVYDEDEGRDIGGRVIEASIEVPSAKVAPTEPTPEPPKNDAETIAAAISEHGVTWESVAIIANEGGLHINPASPIEHQHEGSLKAMRKSIAAIVAQAKKGDQA